MHDNALYYCTYTNIGIGWLESPRFLTPMINPCAKKGNNYDILSYGNNKSRVTCQSVNGSNKAKEAQVFSPSTYLSIHFFSNGCSLRI